MSIELDLSLVEGKRVLCALSGGADSMCLLNLLRDNGIFVTAAHFEHGIRGEEALRDMEFVKAYCEENAIALVCERGDVPSYAKANAMSMEEAARELRYDFLHRQLEKLGLDVIATAHNAEDSAETMVFNLIRGTGLSGLRGIPKEKGKVVRPMLHVRRREIEAYLKERAIPHVEDSTNLSDDYTRNLIRHQLIPVMEKINPAFVRSAGRTGELAGRDEDCLSAMAREFIKEHYREDSLPVKELSDLHKAVSSRVLRELIPGLNMQHVDLALEFIKGSGRGRLSLPGRELRREQGRVYFAPEKEAELFDQSLVPDKKISLPGTGLSLVCEKCIYMGEVNDLFKTSYIKCEIIDSGATVGPRRPGDRLRPLGRGCGKSLKALFMEKGYTQNQRDHTPIIRDSAGPVFVYGIAVDERAVPKPGENAIRLNFKGER